MRKFVIFFFILFSIIFLLKIHVLAEENELPFSVLPVPNFNQNKGVKGYFDLNVKNEQLLQLNVKIKNLKNEKITVYIQSTNALTSPTGGIQYLPTKGTDESYITDQNFELMNLISVQPSIDIPPLKETSLPILVKVPNNESGTYLGGLMFSTTKNNIRGKSKNKNGVVFQIDSNINFAMGIQLNINKTPKENVIFSKTGVEDIPSGILPYVEIENKSAAIVKNFTFQYEFLNKDKKSLFKGTVKSFDMAPKTKIKHLFVWDSEEISPDVYYIKINGEKEKEVVISDSFIEQYQHERGITSEIKWYSNKFIWIGVGAVVIASIILFLFIMKKDNEFDDFN
jgi:hypothetical protein